LQIDGTAIDVIQAPKLQPRITRHELSDDGRAAIKPVLPSKPRCMRREATAGQNGIKRGFPIPDLAITAM
jgi:hypothetical protein